MRDALRLRLGLIGNFKPKQSQVRQAVPSRSRDNQIQLLVQSRTESLLLLIHHWFAALHRKCLCGFELCSHQWRRWTARGSGLVFMGCDWKNTLRKLRFFKKSCWASRSLDHPHHVLLFQTNKLTNFGYTRSDLYPARALRFLRSWVWRLAASCFAQSSLISLSKF